MKSDARVRYTKMIIKSRFMELLQKQAINKITVKNVCAAAEINRATFYKHYTDCFDLLRQIEDEMIVELQQLVLEAHHKDLREIFIKMFAKIKEDSALYLTLASDNGDTTFPNRILHLCYEQMTASIACQFPDMSQQEREWLYYFSANGCSGILSHWLNNGMKEDVSALARFIGDLLDKINSGFGQTPARRSR